VVPHLFLAYIRGTTRIRDVYVFYHAYVWRISGVIRGTTRIRGHIRVVQRLFVERIRATIRIRDVYVWYHA
jgi:hypothetical protein